VNKLIDDIMDFLHTHDFICWQNHITAGLKGYTTYGVMGLPPITIMLKNNHIYIGTEFLTGKQRDSQEAFEQACKTHNHHYILARSVKDVRDKLTQLGEL
jgi:hypothetical protein